MIMKIILVKFDDSDKEFVFEVPDNMHPVKTDIIWVDTAKGERVGIATTDIMEGEESELFKERIGKYFPPQKIKAYANESVQKYIKDCAIPQENEAVSDGEKIE